MIDIQGSGFKVFYVGCYETKIAMTVFERLRKHFRLSSKLICLIRPLDIQMPSKSVVGNFS